MNWKKFMAETEANIATFSKEIPQTAKGFASMGAAAKSNGALDEKTKEFIDACKTRAELKSWELMSKSNPELLEHYNKKLKYMNLKYEHYCFLQFELFVPWNNQYY